MLKTQTGILTIWIFKDYVCDSRAIECLGRPILNWERLNWEIFFYFK